LHNIARLVVRFCDDALVIRMSWLRVLGRNLLSLCASDNALFTFGLSSTLVHRCFTFGRRLRLLLWLHALALQNDLGRLDSNPQRLAQPKLEPGRRAGRIERGNAG
jgi:hypothetical protein